MTDPLAEARQYLDFVTRLARRELEMTHAIQAAHTDRYAADLYQALHHRLTAAGATSAQVSKLVTPLTTGYARVGSLALTLNTELNELVRSAGKLTDLADVRVRTPLSAQGPARPNPSFNVNA